MDLPRTMLQAGWVAKKRVWALSYTLCHITVECRLAKWLAKYLLRHIKASSCFDSTAPSSKLADELPMHPDHQYMPSFVRQKTNIDSSYQLQKMDQVRRADRRRRHLFLQRMSRLIFSRPIRVMRREIKFSVRKSQITCGKFREKKTDRLR